MFQSFGKGFYTHGRNLIQNLFQTYVNLAVKLNNLRRLNGTILVKKMNNVKF